jgi:hypothetical protein
LQKDGQKIQVVKVKGEHIQETHLKQPFFYAACFIDITHDQQSNTIQKTCQNTQTCWGLLSPSPPHPFLGPGIVHRDLWQLLPCADGSDVHDISSGMSFWQGYPCQLLGVFGS